MYRWLRALCRILLITGFTLVALLLFGLGRTLRVKGWRSLPRLWHRTFLRLAGIRVVLKGELRRERPTLFVANHASYFDIPVLGALVPGAFVAKKDIESWPVFGFLAKCQQTIFIERNPRLARLHQDAMRRLLDAGTSLILFPEGTSTDGNRVLPFKSTLFSVVRQAADDRPLLIQPLTVAYTCLNGLPMGRIQRPLVTWYGDMALGPHLWRVLGHSSLTVEVIAHPPLDEKDFPSRKDLARAAHRMVADGLKQALTGQEENT